MLSQNKNSINDDKSDYITDLLSTINLKVRPFDEYSEIVARLIMLKEKIKKNNQQDLNV